MLQLHSGSQNLQSSFASLPTLGVTVCSPVLYPSRVWAHRYPLPIFYCTPYAKKPWILRGSSCFFFTEMSIRKSETIEGYRGRPEDDSSVQRRGKSTPPRSGPQQRARWDIRIPAGGSTSSLLQKTVKSNYVPVVSSPLKTDGNGSDHSEESSSGDVLPGVRPRRSRRSLQIRVIEPPLVTREPALLELSSDDALAEDLGYEWPTQTLEVKQTSSLQSLGRGFSRYPSQKKSESTMGSSVPSSSRTPPGLPIDTGYRHAGHGFNTADPERGFVPYIHRRDLAVCYPGIGEKEDDDSLHNPEDDRGPNWRDYRKNCGWRLCFTTISFLLLVTGPAILFIVWPILSYSAVGRKDSPEEPPETLTNFTYPIVGAIRTSMIDPDTPEYALTRKSALGTGDLKLVFSDEFNQDGRAFYEGDDQFWQAADFHYAATNDLEWYDPDAVTTKDGTLQIRIDAFRNHNLDYRSGMLQSWNKLCFKGGVLEISASLAGPAGTPGLWPGIWTLGNLARPGFQATSDGVWPYSYDQCDVGITPNQSSFDGISFLPGQKLASCTCIGEDHPTPGIGRGAPEIDALEGTAEYKLRVGVVTQSSQVVSMAGYY
jgi:beta-glucanase (GH16 family)